MRVLARHWWVFAIRGVLGILFALIAFFKPGVTMLSLVFVFAAYVVADGLFAVVAAMRAARHNERWTPFLLEGVIAGLLGWVLAAALLIGVKSLLLNNLQQYFSYNVGLSAADLIEVILLAIVIGVLLCGVTSPLDCTVGL